MFTEDVNFTLDYQEVPCLPSPITESESGYSSYGGSLAGSESSYPLSHGEGSYPGQQQQHYDISSAPGTGMGRVSPPSSPESSDSVFTSETSKAPTSFSLPPINMKNNTSFTEAELKAITPWRNALIQRLLENHARDQQQQQQQQPQQQQQQYHQVSRKTPEPPRVSPPNLNVFNLEASQPPARLQMYHKQPQPGGRPRQPRGGQGRGCAPGGGGPPFHDLAHMAELDLGQGQGYEGRIVRGTTAFTAVTGAIKQVSAREREKKTNKMF